MVLNHHCIPLKDRFPQGLKPFCTFRVCASMKAFKPDRDHLWKFFVERENFVTMQ